MNRIQRKMFSSVIAGLTRNPLLFFQGIPAFAGMTWLLRRYAVGVWRFSTERYIPTECFKIGNGSTNIKSLTGLKQNN
jgi:hypothetical protein